MMAKPSAQQGGAARSPCALAATSSPVSCNACLTRVTNTFCANMNKMSTSQVARTVAVLVACRRPLCTSMQNHVLSAIFKNSTRLSGTPVCCNSPGPAKAATVLDSASSALIKYLGFIPTARPFTQCSRKTKSNHQGRAGSSSLTKTYEQNRANVCRHG